MAPFCYDDPAWWEQHYSFPGDRLVAGVDEVGRGSLFGPVVAAAAVVSVENIPKLRQLGVKDSKKLSPKRREDLAQQLPNYLTAYHISFANVPTIDQINIRRASLLAMERSVQRLGIVPACVLVDGRDALANVNFPQLAVTQGDIHSALIGAASILAKVWRDRLIVRLAEHFPGYDLERNKGYGTVKHRQGLRTLGKTPLHRELFCRKTLQDLTESTKN